MRQSRNILLAALSVLFLSACTGKAPEAGIPHSLAQERFENVRNVAYALSFDIPEDRAASIPATETLTFDLVRRSEVYLDFNTSSGSVNSLTVNGEPADAVVENGYLALPGKLLRKGANTVCIDFMAGEQSLNRRDEFLYTLLVPDRARTLFPCFDQPDMKAEYTLRLTVPESWAAVSNTSVASESVSDGRKTVDFNPTEPLSTYLFSFVTGVFSRQTATRNGRSISMYHRETDSARTAQIPDVLNLVFDALEYMEDYTALDYPFAKYDLIAIPDFQYGGMEHTGATLYNASGLFLSGNPTTDELLSRATLIAHETAHMWFGDCVTMKWFNDVWTKEVFANWFAAKIARPAFPDVNYQVMDMKKYYAPSYAEDRTVGSNAVQRDLPRLSDAGLIYCNIIYDKSPVVMEMLAKAMGYDAFRNGIREYVATYKYGNATWDDLIDILEKQTDIDVAEWSRVWIKEKGMPIYSSEVVDGKAVLSQSDPFGAGNVWPQDVVCDVEDGVCIPNSDGVAYGAFLVDEAAAEQMMASYRDYPETKRMSVLMTLYENAWRGNLAPDAFVDWCAYELPGETDPLILSSMLGYASGAAGWCSEDPVDLETVLERMASDKGRSHESRLLAFRQLAAIAVSDRVKSMLYNVWNGCNPPAGLSLSERDYTSLAYQLMIAFPEKANGIASVQRGRISNPDRLETFDYVCRAASPDKEVRESLFSELLEAGENRRPESRVLTALGYLCHRTRAEEAVGYVLPTLENLREIQRTGDIFFPASWCKTVLGSQQSPEAGRIVREYLESHPDFPPLLKTKVLQAIDNPRTAF